MLFTKDNFGEYRLVNFIAQKDRIFINRPGELTNSYLELMSEHRVDFSKKENEYRDMGFMLLRDGEVLLFDNLMYNPKNRDITVDRMQRMMKGVVINDHIDYFSVASDLTFIYHKRIEENNQKKKRSSESELARLALLEYQRNRCLDCGEKTYRLEMHHKLPKSMGGRNSILNYVLLCGKSKSTLNCHKKWNEVAFDKNIIIPGIYKDIVPRKMYYERLRYDR